MMFRIWIGLCSVFLAFLLVSASVPLAAQEGRDLLVPERPGRVHLSFVDRVDAEPVLARVRRVSLVDYPAVRVAQPATEVYQYDDGELAGGVRLVDDTTGEVSFGIEFAQQFRLRRAGTVEYAVVCLGRGPDDTSSNAAFALNFYSGAGSAPGALLAEYDLPDARLGEAGTYNCFEVGGEVEGLRLPGAQVWVSVSYQRGSPPENTKYMMIDDNGPGGGRRAFRGRPEEGDEWEEWLADTNQGTTAYGIRLAVDHPDEPDPDPDPPDPDPDPPPTDEGYTDCVPETTPLVFGDYKVSMCYETQEAKIGEAKAGIWASEESGLLWFFSRSNAEVLIKVLNGCSYNGHRWVFVAPVTDLAFNLYVTDSEDRRWSHRNRLGDPATNRVDTSAFRCRE